MCEVGAIFPLAPEARLVVERHSLIVRFERGDDDRTIVLDPALKAPLAEIVAEHPGDTIRWAELRAMLEAKGADVEAAAARGRVGATRGAV